MDKFLNRSKKAQEDAAFKKKMTERSNYSTVDGVRVARKDHYGKWEHPGYDSYKVNNKV